MIISGSSLLAGSRHTAIRQVTEHSRVAAWVGQRPPEQNAAPAPTAEPTRRTPDPFAGLLDAIQRDRLHARPAPSADSGPEPLISYTPEQEEMLAILERVFGMRVFRGNAPTPRSEPAAPAAKSATAEQPPQAGWGFAYDHSRTTLDYELLEHAIAGSVQTADGRDIAFSFTMRMERFAVTQEQTSIRAGDAVPIDPLIVDLDGRGVHFAGDARHAFDLDDDGSDEHIAAPTLGAAFLAFDHDGNGAIDDGAELFGPRTGNGFAELARHDADGNGWIDAGDPVWEGLVLWRPGEAATTPVAAAGLGAIALSAVDTPFAIADGAGNDAGLMRRSSVYLDATGRAGGVHQVDLYG